MIPSISRNRPSTALLMWAVLLAGLLFATTAFVPASPKQTPPPSTSSSSTTTTTPLQSAPPRTKEVATQKTATTSSTSPAQHNPVVVSEQAEALSHSSTTMKLTPSFQLFQLLEEHEGGEVPPVMSGNALRHNVPGIPTTTTTDDNDPQANKETQPQDTLQGFCLTDYMENTNKQSKQSKQSKPLKSIAQLPDPFQLVEQELKPFSDSIKELVSTDQPILSMAAKHFFEKRHGKRFRPTIIQLLAKTVATAVPQHTVSTDDDDDESTATSTISSTELQMTGASHTDTTITPDNHQGSDVWRRQAQLGQIVEMIHVASLIHDDVLDEADTRRGGEAVHKLYSNKVAVLAGDYLLARASVLLARLENTAVVQIMATALESLVAGEIMQLKSPPESLLQLETYLRKSYYKTASLICYAARSTALLGGHTYDSAVATACEEFGFHLGLAYQIQDDILDFTAAANVLGKPALADMDLGLSTAPILYTAQEQKQLRPLIMRKFKHKGDKQTALEALYRSDTAMDKSRALAHFHAQRAVDALLRLPQSESRDALIRLTHIVVTRKK